MERMRFAYLPSFAWFAVMLSPSCSDMPINSDPAFLSADEADFLEPDDLIIGVVVDAEARAYPIRAMAPIEILNDRIGDVPVAVTWCPLSGTGLVFERRTADDTLVFRFHPDLHKMNLLIEDTETGSLWSQLEARAIAGQYEGTGLTQIPGTQTTWESWRERHPTTRVMQPDWGLVDFSYQPPGRRMLDGIAERELVLAVYAGGSVKGYLFAALARAGGQVDDMVGGSQVRIKYDGDVPSAYATDGEGTLLTTAVIYWKYWPEFFANGSLWGR